MTAHAVPLAAVAFATWAVYLGGLASLQSDCDADAYSRMVGVTGITGSLPCMRVYRFHWFIACWEFVVIAGLAVCAASGRLASLKASFVGLFSIATLLYIQASNSFLTAQSLEYYESGQALHRIRTITAGAIMTALVNTVIVAVVGSTEPAAPAVAEVTVSQDKAAV